MSSVFKFALILLAATILAIGARILYVNSLTAKEAPDPEVLIRTAVTDLPAGLLLREGDMAWTPVSKSRVPKDAVQKGSAQSELVGALLRHKIVAGGVLKNTGVIRPDAPGFLAAALRPGTVAVSVPINNVSGNAGLIRPGDYVDMILTQHLEGGGDFSGRGKRVVSETVVEQVRVIAVGSSFKQNSDKEDSTRARTVTIEVRPRIAQAVTVASELGSLSLALRSFARTDTETDGLAEEASVVAWGQQLQNQPEGPVWGHDVSRARQGVEQNNNTHADAKPKSSSIPATVIRGIKPQIVELKPDAQ